MMMRLGLLGLAGLFTLMMAFREDPGPRHNAQLIQTKLLATERQLRDLKDAFDDLDRRMNEKVEALAERLAVLETPGEKR